MANPETATTEAQTEETTPEVTESAQEQLERIENEYKATRKNLLAKAKTETKDGAQTSLDQLATGLVSSFVAECEAAGLKLNNFTVRYKGGDVVAAVEAVEAVAKNGKVAAIAAVEAVEGVDGISTVLNVVRAPKNSEVVTVVEPDATKQAEVKAAAAAKA